MWLSWPGTLWPGNDIFLGLLLHRGDDLCVNIGGMEQVGSADLKKDGRMEAGWREVWCATNLPWLRRR